MKILIISPCTATQKYRRLPNQLKPTDFQSSDPNHLPMRIKELSDYKAPAADMYKGRGHILLMDGLRSVREHNQSGKTTIDLHIISTGFGLINERKDIVPYNVPNGESDILCGSGREKLNANIKKLVKNYDLVFFLLGGKYVKALQLPIQGTDLVTQIFLLGKTDRKMIIELELPNYHCILAGEILRKQLHTTYNDMKGLVFKRLCKKIYNNGIQVFEDIKNDPQLILDIIQ